MPTDRELLGQYARQGDEAAFAEIVQRHADLVYSVARRLTANGVWAEDVTQSVFTKLARQAGVLRRYETIVGWLHTTTRYTAIDVIRGEERRRSRELEASIMQNETSTPSVNWEEIGPILDEAVGRLPEQDREAVLLRFFKNLSHKEVDAELGLSEDTARKRVERALEKLQAYFSKRGVKASSAILAMSIGNNSVNAAPVGLVAQTTSTALAQAGGAGLGSAFLLNLLYMSTKTKLVTVAAVVLTMGILLSIIWSVHSQQTVTATNVPAKPAPAAVVRPALPAVTETSPVGSTLPQRVKPQDKAMANGSTTPTTHPSAIHFEPEPANGHEVVMAALRKRAGVKTPEPALLDINLVEAKPRFGYYNLSTIAIANGEGFATVQEEGFSYTVQSAGQPYAIAEVQLDDTGATGVVKFMAGKDDMVQPLAQLATLDQLQKGSYEARRLYVRMQGATGGMLTGAIWLKSDPGGTDLIFPYVYGGPAGELQKNRLYTVKEFLDALQPLAKARVENRFPADGG